MTYFLTSLPLWLSGLLVVGLPTVLAMVGPILVRRYVTLERLTTNNEVAGFKFAAGGVLYALLLAFAPFATTSRIDRVLGVASAGLDMLTAGGTVLKLSYDGRYGDTIRDSSVTGRASIRF